MQLAKERARLWQASPAKVADWLNASLGLRSRYPVTELVNGVLWHLAGAQVLGVNPRYATADAFNQAAVAQII